MRRKILQKIYKGLPADFMQNAVRDVSLPTSAVFVDIHGHGLPKTFGVKFTAVFMHHCAEQAGILRSPKEYRIFASKLANKLSRDQVFTRNLVKKLIFYSDCLYKFVKEQKTLKDFIKHKDDFFEKYTLFFIYHQAVQFGGDYLAAVDIPAREKKAVKVLRKAYQYNENEMVVPLMEKYFHKLGVQNLLPEEINNNVKANIKNVPKNRSLIIFKRQIIILTEAEANWLKLKIDKKNETEYKNKKSISGTAACKGFYRGKARVITELNKLGSVKKSEVLIATMTRPQYNSVLNKLGAIVTDEGGMVCHAAIIAREFKIPCVVGTKYATKIFHNGDMVEVDANRGVVRKLNK